MSLLAGLGGDQNPHASPTARPLIARARVIRAPIAAGGSLAVVVPNYSQAYEYEVFGDHWTLEGELPQVGDRCVVLFDDDGDIWVASWERGTPGVYETSLLGVFIDFANGVKNAPLTNRDPGTPTRFDSLTTTDTGVLVYDNSTTHGLSFLPKIVKFTSSTASSGYVSVGHPRPTEWTWYGRIFFSFTPSPSAGIRLVEWREGTAGRCRFQVTSSDKIEVRDNGGTLLASSQVTLEAGKAYRIEWEVVPGTSTGVITLKIFEGQETSPIEVLVSAPANTGTRVDLTRFGNANNGNIQSTLRFGGFADGLRSPAGPYTGPPAPTFAIVDSATGEMFGGFDHDGAFFLSATGPFLYDGGRFRVNPGDEIFRFDPVHGNLIIGVNRAATKDPVSGGPSFFNGFDIPSGRWHGRSYNVTTINDPPDITMIRAEIANTEASGTNGSTEGSLFSSSTIDFQPIDLGRYLVIGGVEYIIRELIDRQTAVMEDKLTQELATFPVASGVSWERSQYPWPHTLSGGRGAVGQVRTSPVGFSFIRSGVDGVTNGTQAFTASSGAFTSNDVGRYIMVGDSPLRVYEIIARISPTQVTLFSADPISASGQSWKIAGSPYDEGFDLGHNPHTLGFRCEKGALSFSSDNQETVVPSTSLRLSMSNPEILQGGPNSFSSREVFEVWGDGLFKLFVGDLQLDGVDRRYSDPGKAADAVTNGTNTITSATAKFTSADIGRYIQIAGSTLRTWLITAVNSSTSITVAGPDPVSASSQQWIICRGGAVTVTAPDGLTTKRLGVDVSGAPMWGPTGLPMIVRKPSDETVNNSIAFQNDDHLLFHGAANAIYYVEAVLRVTSPSVNSDLKVSYSKPAGATHEIQRGQEAAGVAPGSSPGGLQTAGVSMGGSNSTYLVKVVGYITMGTTPGPVNLQWAQDTATVENTVVKANSFLSVTRIA